MPLSRRRSAATRRLPVMTTTVVVPSPASTSCAAERSTNYKSTTPNSSTYHSRSRMQHSHVFQNRSPVISDNSRLIRLNHLVHTLWSQTRTNCIRDTCVSVKRRRKLFAAVIFERRTSMGFSLSWNLLPLTPEDVLAMMRECLTTKEKWSGDLRS